MACILISCLSAYTLRAVPLISRASVVQVDLELGIDKCTFLVGGQSRSHTDGDIQLPSFARSLQRAVLQRVTDKSEELHRSLPPVGRKYTRAVRVVCLERTVRLVGKSVETLLRLLIQFSASSVRCYQP